jgi:methyl-accepting chemotaxis protein
MVQLDSVIQQNASGSEEMTAMAEELAGQSQQLAASVGFFKLPKETSAGLNMALIAADRAP